MEIYLCGSKGRLVAHRFRNLRIAHVSRIGFATSVLHMCRALMSRLDVALYITLHYIIVIYTLQMSFQMPFESTHISKFLESKRKIIPSFQPGIGEASLAELALQ